MPQDNRMFNKQGSAKFGAIAATLFVILLVGVALWWNHYELPRRQKQQAVKVEQPTAPAPAQMAASQPQAVVPQTPPPKQESAQAPVAKEEKKAASIPKQKQDVAQATTAKQKEARATTVRRQDVVNTSTAATTRASNFTVFDTVSQCEAVREAGKARAYHPRTKAPFQGGPGWTEKVVPAGGACLGGAYVLEDGVPVRNKVVFVESGFRYYEHTSGAFRMADCSNPFESILLAKAKPSTPVVVQEPAVTTAVIEEKKVLKVVPYCELPDGTQVKAAIVNGEAVCPELKFRAPVTVDQPVRIQPHVTATPVVPAPPPQAAPQRKAQAPCTDCRAEARVLGEEPSPHGICGIRAVDQAGRTVGLIQIDSNRGTIRYALVSQWAARPTLIVNTTERSSPRRDCNDDQAVIERHWDHVIKSLRLPLDCRPNRPQVSIQPAVPQQRYVAPVSQM